jgi:hypothetical protein
MREMTSHKAGRTYIWVLALSALWYVFVLPFVVQNSTYLFLGWMPLVVLFWNVQTILWLVATYIYTKKYWPLR